MSACPQAGQQQTVVRLAVVVGAGEAAEILPWPALTKVQLEHKVHAALLYIKKSKLDIIYSILQRNGSTKVPQVSLTYLSAAE